MHIKPIRNDADLQEAFKRLEMIFQAEEGTLEFDEMEILTTLIEVYENKYYPINAATPVDAIKPCRVRFYAHPTELAIRRFLAK